MYSAELDKQTVLALKRNLKTLKPDLAQAVNEINQILLEKRKACQAKGQTMLIEQEPPELLLKALHKFCQKAEAWLVLNQASAFREDLLDFYFECRRYLRTADEFDNCYVSYFERRGKSDLNAKLFCMDPSTQLMAALTRSQSATFFSATLLPLDYFEQLLTGTNSLPKLMLPSPFPPKNVKLLIHNRIATKYARRSESYAPIAATIKALCNAHQGNYLVFFPSYAYLTAVLELLQDQIPEQQLLVQNRGMTEVERESFLAQFSDSPSETLIGLAVMGGIFGEGIDLVGNRLVGTIIVGVGLPQLNPERDLIKNYFAQQNRRGFEYAYQYPGLNRVLQAAGRVIRTEQDRGVILLIDERFTQYRYTTLFPPEWRNFQAVQGNADLKEALIDFWAETAATNLTIKKG